PAASSPQRGWRSRSRRSGRLDFVNFAHLTGTHRARRIRTSPVAPGGGMRRSFGPILLAAALLGASPGMLRGASIVELGRDAPALFNPGATGFAVADVDGDGGDDLVFAGGAPNPVLAVYGRRDDGSLGLKQVLPMPWQHMIQRVIPWRTGGVPHIVVIE